MAQYSKEIWCGRWRQRTGSCVDAAGIFYFGIPWGGREVLKRKGEAYQLIWKQRYGFLKLAQEFNYDIIPFAALGGDEIFELGFDANTLIQSQAFQQLLKIAPLDRLLRHGDVIPSLPKNIIPKRIAFYFQFMPPQSLIDIKTTEQLRAFRDQIQQQIYAGLAQLRQQRDADDRFNT